jgi:hypothetical protein
MKNVMFSAMLVGLAGLQVSLVGGFVIGLFI